MKQNERKGGCERRRVTESRYVIPRIPHPSFQLLLRGVGDTTETAIVGTRRSPPRVSGKLSRPARPPRYSADNGRVKGIPRGGRELIDREAGRLQARVNRPRRPQCLPAQALSVAARAGIQRRGEGRSSIRPLSRDRKGWRVHPWPPLIGDDHQDGGETALLRSVRVVRQLGGHKVEDVIDQDGDADDAGERPAKRHGDEAGPVLVGGAGANELDETW
jgi:hypothetical protein